jgi:hypothetical protein
MFLRGFRDRRFSTPPGDTGGVVKGEPGSNVSGMMADAMLQGAHK